MGLPFEHVALLTPEDLALVSDAPYNAKAPGNKSERDDALIAEVSAEITQRLQQHTLRAEREETHMLRAGARRILLRGAEVDTDEIFIEIGGNVLEVDSDFVLDAERGVVILDQPVKNFSWAASGRTHFQCIVTYTGGMAETVEALKAAHPSLHSAAIKQAQYRAQRAKSLGGSMSVPQGMTALTQGQYNILRVVKDVCKQYRRGGI